MVEYVMLIPLYPLLSFLLLLLFGHQLKQRSVWVAVACALCSFVHSVVVLSTSIAQPTYKVETVWFTIGELQITAGVSVNPLNLLMLIIVSFVSLLVHVYSKGYMQGDKRISIFYAYLSLFTFAMLGLVLSPNLLQLYIFWELVGLGSFLLIGFYFYKKEAKAAAQKAFIMTRIGDIGLFIGMMLLFWEVGSFEFDAIFQAVDQQAIPLSMITWSSILIFIGAIGKSGQFPLHTWLPDAMEGPTPVSALIHAATMVAAGVYLVATMFPLFAASETALLVVAVIGAFTAIFAASIGLVQNDIKRVLAYSTISQLGYMMLALGSAGYVAGVFHLMTHAFFKALLFLAAGSVIHAVSSQNIGEMGGLWKKMKRTGPLFLIGTMAISGVPLLSGFFSKEEILLATWSEGHYVLFISALLTAFLTAFYMFRLFFLVFAGTYRGKASTIHESPLSMLFPMIILALLAIFSGYVNSVWFGTYLGDWLVKDNAALGYGHHPDGPLWMMVVATVVSLAGILFAYLMYVKQHVSRDWLGGKESISYRWLSNRYYVDELYRYSIIPLVTIVSVVLSFIDRFLIQGLMYLISGSVLLLGKLGSKLQSGQVQQYVAVVISGLAFVLIIYAMTGGLL